MGLMAEQVASMCPGWRVWQGGDDDGTWHGRRDGGLVERPDDCRACHVEAGDIAGLVAAIDAQAALDLAADFPGWAVTRDEAGRWAASRGGDTVTALTGALLHAEIGASRRRAVPR